MTKSEVNDKDRLAFRDTKDGPVPIFAFAGFVVGCDFMERAGLGDEYVQDASLGTLWRAFQEVMS